MKRQIEMEDNLDEYAEGAIEEVKDELLSHLEQNPDTEKLPCISNDLDYSGAIHQIIDGSVPIYTKEIEDTDHLHSDDLDQAFDDAGLGTRDDDWPMGWKAAAIYCYIEQQVHQWYRDEAQDIFDEWLKKKNETASA